MGGVGERFLKAGYRGPKPLLDVAGEPLIKRLLGIFPRDWRFVFPCNSDHLQHTRLREVLLAAAPNAVIVPIAPHKLGPVHSVLQAVDHIDDELPTIVNYCDFSFSWDPAHFVSFIQRTACDGAVFCYRGFHPHYLGNTLYAYCREENGVIKEIREKGHFTPDRTQEWASSGTYYFSSGRLVKQSFEETKRRNLVINGEFYVSVVYNPIIESGKKVLVYEIPFMLQWGTPDDLEDYNYWHRSFDALKSNRGRSAESKPRLLMPMAGFGSRFKSATLPKPLIPVMGTPMYRTAERYLPCQSDRVVHVVRKDFEFPALSAFDVILDQPTRGQAETVLQGLAGFAADEPLLVSACDHGLVYDGPAWDSLLREGPDVVVVGQRNYPGARRTPKSFAYIDADSTARIKNVSVKEPISAVPQKDLLLVGTFYFRRADQLRSLIEDLIARDMRVNGEYYLDSVVNIAVQRGWNVRVFESQSYLNWGSPDALAEFSYWQRYFQGGNL